LLSIIVSDTVVVDRIQLWTPPFEPSVVVTEASEIVKRYGVASVTGDDCAGEWPVEFFRTCGIAYDRSEKNKSELYLALIPAGNGNSLSCWTIAASSKSFAVRRWLAYLKAFSQR
jgi:hypothetical protein